LYWHPNETVESSIQKAEGTSQNRYKHLHLKCEDTNQNTFYSSDLLLQSLALSKSRLAATIHRGCKYKRVIYTHAHTYDLYMIYSTLAATLLIYVIYQWAFKEVLREPNGVMRLLDH